MERLQKITKGELEESGCSSPYYTIHVCRYLPNCLSSD